MAVLVCPRVDFCNAAASTVQPPEVNAATSTIPPEPPEPDERLDDKAVFDLFVARVMRCADRWLALYRVPPDDRADVMQEALLRMYQRREEYNPARGGWEDWAFGFVGHVASNYHRSTWRRLRRVDVAAGDLPDIAIGGPSPEEETEAGMMQALLNKCLASLDETSRIVVLAKAEGRSAAAIATAIGVTEPTARAYIRSAREGLQKALDREQGRKRALGALVLPVTLDRLLASEGKPADVPAETMRQIWKALDRVMDADIAAGKLRNDGAALPRYMGAPSNVPRPSLAARVLRALVSPRGLPALTYIAGSVVTGVVVYEIMKGVPPRTDTTADVRTVESSTPARRGPAPAPSTAPSAGLVEEPAVRADAGAPGPSATPTSSASAAVRDDIGEEEDIYNQGKIAYKRGLYPEAIKAFERQAGKFPRGRYADMGNRLLILSLIGAHRKPEASARIEQLRRADPDSQTVKELERALRAAD